VSPGILAQLGPGFQLRFVPIDISPLPPQFPSPAASGLAYKKMAGAAQPARFGNSRGPTLPSPPHFPSLLAVSRLFPERREESQSGDRRSLMLFITVRLPLPSMSLKDRRRIVSLDFPEASFFSFFPEKGNAARSWARAF